MRKLSSRDSTRHHTKAIAIYKDNTIARHPSNNSELTKHHEQRMPTKIPPPGTIGPRTCPISTEDGMGHEDGDKEDVFAGRKRGCFGCHDGWDDRDDSCRKIQRGQKRWNKKNLWISLEARAFFEFNCVEEEEAHASFFSVQTYSHSLFKRLVVNRGISKFIFRVRKSGSLMLLTKKSWTGQSHLKTRERPSKLRADGADGGRHARSRHLDCLGMRVSHSFPH